jgi:hypothetical protein
MNHRVLKNVIIVELRISELKNIQKLYYRELKINEQQYPETLLS